MISKRNEAVFLVSLLVVGNLIGAGILALPVQTGGAGLTFSAAAMVIFALAMLFSAKVLADEAVDEKNDEFNYPSLYGRYLGVFGKWLAALTNLLILYGLLTAYLCGGASVIMSLLDIDAGNAEFARIAVMTALFLGLSILSLGGTAIIARYNGWLMLALAAAFAGIVAMAAVHVRPERELFFNYKFLPIAVPVILTSFHFHNIIPSISRHLEWDARSVFKAMAIGMGIGFAMNFIWVAVGIGVLPLTLGQHSIVNALEHGLPATVPISKILHSTSFSVFAATFAIVAICTSYVANGMGLMDFNRDLLRSGEDTRPPSKPKLAAATFIPPFIIAVFFPGVFLKAIGVVGGVGIAILFGILPSILFYLKNKSPKKRILAITMALLFLSALCADLANDLGFINTDKAIAELKSAKRQRGE